MIKGVKFVSVPVTDPERALEFYTDILGCVLATDQPFDDKQRWIELCFPGAQTKLVLFSQPPQKADWGTAAIFQDPDGNTFVLSSKT